MIKNAYNIDMGRLVADLEELACAIESGEAPVLALDYQSSVEADNQNIYCLKLVYTLDREVPELHFVYDKDEW